MFTELFLISSIHSVSKLSFSRPQVKPIPVKLLVKTLEEHSFDCLRALTTGTNEHIRTQIVVVVVVVVIRTAAND